MIGQKLLKGWLNVLIHENKLPRFSIIAGPTGSGKHLIAHHVSTKLGALEMMLPDVKVDTIRDMISNAYKIVDKTVIIIPDADSMSPAAKNALLKVTEEPPNNVYFIMTLTDTNNTLDTIKSRATIFKVDPYKPEEILEYARSKYEVISGEVELIIDICETPGEVDILKTIGVFAFTDYVTTVVDNIAEVSDANSFKISDKISFKADDGKYDLRLFWKAFMKVCMDRISDDPIKYSHAVKITSKYFQDLRVTGINKQSTFDAWVLDIREEWR